jgi:hypothetical protein
MLALPGVRAALLGEDRVRRKGAAERPDDGAFGLVVGLGHEVDGVGFARDFDPVETLKVDAASRARGGERHSFQSPRLGRKLRAHREWDVIRRQRRYPA